MAKKHEPIYKILFVQQDKLYEIYAEYISEETLIGFIEAENIIFADNSVNNTDPNEEGLKNEFKAVKRCYIPIHTIVRIDEVVKEGPAKIHAIRTDNVSHFPNALKKQNISTERS